MSNKMEKYLIKKALLSEKFTEKLQDFDYIYQGDGKIAKEFCDRFNVKPSDCVVRLLPLIFTLGTLLIFF
jgi:hypothetical protein